MACAPCAGASAGTSPTSTGPVGRPNESYRFAPDGSEIFPPAYFDVQTLTVHHTVTANNDADPAATVRAIYFDMAVTQDLR